MPRMVRTNVVLDDELVGRVMEVYGLRSKRAAIHFALEAVLHRERDVDPITDPWKAALEMEGSWADRTEEELRAIYGDEWPEPRDP
jgi:Arc/MetJ family transcription regulator